MFAISSRPSPDRTFAERYENIEALPLRRRKVLIIVENLPVPFDRRVWQEAQALKAAGATVSVICPKGKGYDAATEELNGVHIFRHDLPTEGEKTGAYLREYATALWAEFKLAWMVYFKIGFDTIHACNPPDLIFLVALPFKALGCTFIFDHHDINPELYEAKFNRRDLFWRLLRFFERMTFLLADVSIATNESYRSIAIERGKMDPQKVFVVRSGPDLDKMTPVDPSPDLKRGRRFLLGYVGVMGDQEGIDLLLEAMRHIVYDLKRTDVQLAMAGSGPSLPKFQDLSRRLCVEGFVTFLGRVPDQRLFELLSTADVCVNPDRVSAMNDLSTMNKIMEYMSFAKPIVQFEVREGRFSAREASLYARANDPGDLAGRILELLDDEDKRREMGRYGRERVVRSLSWRTQVPNLIAAYQMARRAVA